MTYGVPYSFVPGTKARADEVNANFIEVLNKIEETNTRIDEANTQNNANKEEIEQVEQNLKTELAKKAGLDLANLNTAGKAVLNNKANAADIDGKWIYKTFTLLGSVAGPVSGKYVTVSLASYLPSGSSVYDVILRADIEAKAKGSYGLYAFGSDLMNNWFTFGRVENGRAYYAGNTVRVPVNSTKKVYIKSNNSTVGSNMLYVAAICYRKVR